jgi:hypothetical protein
MQWSGVGLMASLLSGFAEMYNRVLKKKYKAEILILD